MTVSASFSAAWDGECLQVLWEDADRVFCRLWSDDAEGDRHALIPRLGGAEHRTLEGINRLTHEYELKDYLDAAWALRPVELVREGGRTMLCVEYSGGEPLDHLIGQPIEIGQFLRFAVGLSSALGQLHRSGLIHKDIKPANVLVDSATGQVWLTGFGIASRLPRERQSPEPPEVVAGTLAYMAPEQTGRMNRAIDARSDLYALGVTLYEMLTGSLPFIAADPMEWVHCHIARRAMPPCERVQVPLPVSAIIMKLLAKAAEERYQTAGGLERDLRCCLAQFEATGRIEDFALGECDTPDHLLFHEKLYGRARAIEILVTAFDRIQGGAPELVLVSGDPGVGKSAVVNELQKVLVPSRGLFAAGKFDQYKREIPYSTVAQALQGLVRPLLAMSDVELGDWREAIREALGPNGLLMVDLVPELKLIIGEQVSVPELLPQDAQRRFQLVFRRFLAVFARPEHPLVLFIDDLQWLDVATLDLLVDLLTAGDVRHLLLVGAYRDNEVRALHPLVRKLDALRQTGAILRNVALSSLAPDDLLQLIADALHAMPDHVRPLAELVQNKTEGNPFFAIQFLNSLADEGLLTFDYGAAQWAWDQKRTLAKGYTDNVVDLMVRKLGRLPTATQQRLRLLACLGSVVELATLRIVCEGSPEAVDADLWEALHQELILRTEGAYRFAHDRVQEAAYSLIPEAQRAGIHLRIGRLLLEHTSLQGRAEQVFEIVNHLNRGVALITSRDERDQLAELNLIAGKRAKLSTAHVSAMRYFVAGSALLSDEGWAQRPDLKFALELHRAECEFATGELTAAEERLTTLASRATNPVDGASVACLQMELYSPLNRIDRSVDICLDYLRHLGVESSPHPTEYDVRAEYERIGSLLGPREIEDLIDLPLMSHPESLATLAVLTGAFPHASVTDMNLYALLVCRAVIVSVEQGNTDASCIAYAHMCAIAGARFRDYQAGSRFGRLGCDLTEKRGLRRFESRTYHYFGYLSMWTQHLRKSCEWLRRAFDTANRVGDLVCARYASIDLNAYLLAAGDPLLDRQRHAELCLETAQRFRFGLDADIITPALLLIRTLRGLTATFGCFNGPQFDELEHERYLSSSSGFAGAACTYWIRKLQARYLAGDYIAAVAASLNAQQLLWTSIAVLKSAEAHFYGALSRAAMCDPRYPIEYQQHVEALKAHYKTILEWVENCPENFENRAALVGAEIARIEGRELDAERMYEQAIKSARDNGFVHNQAIAAELAARFYQARGLNTIARAYMRDARHGYLQWGAEGKVRQLDQLYPHLRAEYTAPAPTDSIGAIVEQLDLATVIKVSQAVSGEMVLDKLIDTVMRTAVEHAGAERAVLMLSPGAGQRIAAVATTRNDAVVVCLCDEPVTASALPESIVRYVLNTQESVILDDAAILNPFSTDPYIGQGRARSVVCLPLTNRAKQIGVLYLENNLTTRVFAPARIAVLKLLASQAAMSLENAHLYRDLAEREARIRRLMDANIIGIVISDGEGRILETNDAFLNIVRYDREDLASQRVRWSDMTPPERRERDQQYLVPELKLTGSPQPFEKEFFRKDGSRVPVLIGVANFEDGGGQGVAFVLDLSERRRAADALREVQMELAHANRLATLGQLAATIAHEVNQPIGAARNNAHAALRFLSAEPPVLAEVVEALECVVNDTYRAGDIVARIRDQVKKVPPRKEAVDLNAAIGEVIALVRGELLKHRVSAQMHLAADLPPAHADRVQLQQVMMNLILNAVEAMTGLTDDARELVISTELVMANVLQVTVADSGPGVALEARERIFESFYSTKSAGIGIGLSICRFIIDGHGGRLWTDARLPRGAIFRFSLPMHT